MGRVKRSNCTGSDLAESHTMAVGKFLELFASRIQKCATLASMNRQKAFFALFILALTWGTAFCQQPDLAVVKIIRLTGALDGFDGKLELLEDVRITPDVQKALWGMGDPDTAFYGDADRIKQLTVPALKPAVLRLEDERHKIIFEKTLERELARIQVQDLHPGQRTILVTTDLSIGMGSYAGPSTELYQVNGSRLEAVTARYEKTGEVDPIELMSSLKTAWKLVPASSGQTNQKDILELACRPNGKIENTQFYKIYSRYHWDGRQWVLYGKKVPGMWESDDAFPPSQKFPGPATLSTE